MYNSQSCQEVTTNSEDNQVEERGNTERKMKYSGTPLNDHP